MKMFVKSAVADQRGVGRGDGDEKSREAVEKTAPENIGAQESPARTHDHGRRGPYGLRFKLALQKYVGEIVHFLHITIYRGICVMMQIAGEFFLRAGEFDFAMFGAALPFAGTALDEPQDVVGIPVAVGDPAAEEPNFAREISAGITLVIALKKFLDGCAEFGGDFLVGIKAQHPRLRAVTE